MAKQKTSKASVELIKNETELRKAINAYVTSKDKSSSMRNRIVASAKAVKVKGLTVIPCRWAEVLTGDADKRMKVETREAAYKAQDKTSCVIFLQS